MLHIRLGGQASLWRWYLIQGQNERAGDVRAVFWAGESKGGGRLEEQAWQGSV